MTFRILLGVWVGTLLVSMSTASALWGQVTQADTPENTAVAPVLAAEDPSEAQPAVVADQTDTDTADTQSTTTMQAVTVTVHDLVGMVQYRPTEDQPWQQPMVGMPVPMGAEFRTGPRSAVRLFIPPDQYVTLDRLGVIKVITALAEADKAKTELGMQYGRTSYEVEAAGVEHDSVLHSPGLTLAIRGTQKVTLFNQGSFFGVGTSQNTHTNMSDGQKDVDFGEGDQAGVTEGSDNAADDARRNSNNNTGPINALTPLEQYISSRQSMGNSGPFFPGLGNFAAGQFLKRNGVLGSNGGGGVPPPEVCFVPPTTQDDVGNVAKFFGQTFEGTPANPRAMGDFNCDNRVSLIDLSIVAQNLNKPAPPPAKSVNSEVHSVQ